VTIAFAVEESAVLVVGVFYGGQDFEALLGGEEAQSAMNGPEEPARPPEPNEAMRCRRGWRSLLDAPEKQP
jgi:hypothetical protein